MILYLLFKENTNFTHSYSDVLTKGRLTAARSKPNKLNINQSLFVHKNMECYDMLAMSKDPLVRC